MKNTIEYIIDNEVEEIFNNFTEFFNVRIALFSKDGREIKTGLNKNCSLFCDSVRNNLEMIDNCHDNDNYFRQIANKTGKPVHYFCHAGLMEATYPIYIFNEIIGYIMIGQIKTNKKIKKVIFEKWKKKFNNNKIINGFNKLTYIPNNKIESFLQIFNTIIENIINKNYIKIKNNILIDKIINYIKDNINKNISLLEVSELVNKSETLVSHLFKKITGNSFKHTLLTIKLTKAIEYFENDSDITIREVSNILGFNDQYYFSRIFKKYFGKSPSFYKKK